MELKVDERTRRAVDSEMKYFLNEHRRGSAQETKHVCGHVYRVLESKNIKADYDYLELRWHELLSQGPEPPPQPKEKKDKKGDKWKILEPIVFDYLTSLPPTEALDEKAARQAVGDAITALEEFKYNGRAVENLLDKEKKQKVRLLQREGFVRPHSVILKNYTVYYWEPHRGKADEKQPDPEKNNTEHKCRRDISGEELNRLDTKIDESSDGADVYLKDETWGAEDGEK